MEENQIICVQREAEEPDDYKYCTPEWRFIKKHHLEKFVIAINVLVVLSMVVTSIIDSEIQSVETSRASAFCMWLFIIVPVITGLLWV